MADIGHPEHKSDQRRKLLRSSIARRIRSSRTEKPVEGRFTT